MTGGEPPTEEELINEFMFLRKYVPPNIEEMGVGVLEEIEEKRNEILKRQRSAFLFLYQWNDIKVNSISALGLYNIFQISSLPRNISPNITQKLTYLLVYLLSHADILAAAVQLFKKNNEYHFLINMAIPSLFSFFISQESSNQAFVFYMHVLQIFKAQDCIDIISPYFNSIIGFRYIETVMNTFLPKFVADIKVLKRTKKVYKTYTNNLFNAITGAICLIPSEILTLLHLTKAQKWTDEQLLILFFDRFFATQSERYLISSPYKHLITIYKEIELQVRNDPSLINRLTSHNTKFQIPQLFKPFGDSSSRCLITVHEAEVLLKCILMHNPSEKPYTIREMDLKCDFDVECPLALTIFPKQDSKIVFPKFENIVFQNRPSIVPENQNLDRMYQQLKALDNDEKYTKNRITAVIKDSRPENKEFSEYVLKAAVSDLRQQSCEFERLMWYQMNFRIVQDWYLLSESRNEIFTSLATIKFSSTSNLTKEKIIKNVSKFAGFGKALRLSCSIALKPKIDNAILENQQTFDEIEKNWISMISKKSNFVDSSLLSTLNKTSQTLFWDGVELLSSSQNIPLESRIEVIFEAIKLISTISVPRKDIEYLYSLALVLSFPKEFLKTMLIASSIFMNNPQFMKTVPENQLLNWAMFEGFILKFIATDASLQLQSQFMALQVKLISST